MPQSHVAPFMFAPHGANYHAPLSCKTIMRATRAIMQGAWRRAVYNPPPRGRMPTELLIPIGANQKNIVPGGLMFSRKSNYHAPLSCKHYPAPAHRIPKLHRGSKKAATPIRNSDLRLNRIRLNYLRRRRLPRQSRLSDGGGVLPNRPMPAEKAWPSWARV